MAQTDRHYPKRISTSWIPRGSDRDEGVVAEESLLLLVIPDLPRLLCKPLYAGRLHSPDRQHSGQQ